MECCHCNATSGSLQFVCARQGSVGDQTFRIGERIPFVQAPFRRPVFKNNYAEKKIRTYVCTHITSKRIELEYPGWSGFVANSKRDQT